MPKVVTYNSIYNFNAEWAASKTAEEFAEQHKHHDLTKAQLKEAHALCKKAVQPEAPAAEPVSENK